MKEYIVTWSIDVSANSPEEAAKQAREMAVCPNTTATVYNVVCTNGDKCSIDLGQDN